jgi:hypothetical protein
VEISSDQGFLPDVIQPRDYGFRHFMWGTAGKGGINQSSGPWPGWSGGNFKKHPDGWADENWKYTAKWFRAIGIVDCDDTEQYDSVLINGRAWGVARSGHGVPHGRIVYDSSGRKLYRYKDSYDRYLYDSRPYTGGA